MKNLKTAEVIRCLEMDLYTDKGRQEYALMVFHNGGGDEYREAYEHFKQKQGKQ